MSFVTITLSRRKPTHMYSQYGHNSHPQSDRAAYGIYKHVRAKIFSCPCTLWVAVLLMNQLRIYTYRHQLWQTGIPVQCHSSQIIVIIRIRAICGHRVNMSDLPSVRSIIFNV